MTAIVTTAASASLHHQFVQADIDDSPSTQVAREITSGATSEDASSLYAVPIAEANEIDDFRRQAYLEGFRAHGLVGGGGDARGGRDVPCDAAAAGTPRRGTLTDRGRAVSLSGS